MKAAIAAFKDSGGIFVAVFDDALGAGTVEAEFFDQHFDAHLFEGVGGEARELFLLASGCGGRLSNRHNDVISYPNRRTCDCLP